MRKNYFLAGATNKISFWVRSLAKIIDFFFIIVVATFFYPLGVFAGALYLILADSIQTGQSVGKKILGLKVISLKDGSPCAFNQSFIRNLPFLIPLLIGIVPLWGWLLGVVVFLILVALEFYLMVRLDSGHRLGDVMADTTVVLAKSEEDFISKKNKSWFKN